MADDEIGRENWAEVVARSVAMMCLRAADRADKSVGVQADFLSRLGLRRDTIAELLATTPDTVRVEIAKRRREGARRGKRSE